MTRDQIIALIDKRIAQLTEERRALRFEAMTGNPKEYGRIITALVELIQLRNDIMDGRKT